MTAFPPPPLSLAPRPSLPICVSHSGRLCLLFFIFCCCCCCCSNPPPPPPVALCDLRRRSLVSFASSSLPPPSRPLLPSEADESVLSRLVLLPPRRLSARRHAHADDQQTHFLPGELRRLPVPPVAPHPPRSRDNLPSACSSDTPHTPLRLLRALCLLSLIHSICFAAQEDMTDMLIFSDWRTSVTV